MASKRAIEGVAPAPAGISKKPRLDDNHALQVPSSKVCDGKNLLDLPGEIRNHIYACTVTSSTVVRLLPPPKHASADSKETSGMDWGTLKREDLGLSQVCRQLRTEYLPIHFQHTEIEVEYRNLQEYANNCCSPILKTDNQELIKSHRGNLTVLCWFWYRETIKPVDILPLFKLVAAAPNMRCRFHTLQDPGALTARALDQLLEDYCGELRHPLKGLLDVADMMRVCQTPIRFVRSLPRGPYIELRMRNMTGRRIWKKELIRHTHQTPNTGRGHVCSWADLLEVSHMLDSVKVADTWEGRREEGG